jgi:hypothetical protein
VPFDLLSSTSDGGFERNWIGFCSYIRDISLFVVLGGRGIWLDDSILSVWLQLILRGFSLFSFQSHSFVTNMQCVLIFRLYQLFIGIMLFYILTVTCEACAM